MALHKSHGRYAHRHEQGAFVVRMRLIDKVDRAVTIAMGGG